MAQGTRLPPERHGGGEGGDEKPHGVFAGMFSTAKLLLRQRGAFEDVCNGGSKWKERDC